MKTITTSSVILLLVAIYAIVQQSITHDDSLTPVIGGCLFFGVVLLFIRFFLEEEGKGKW